MDRIIQIIDEIPACSDQQVRSVKSDNVRKA